jgi:hypothetical protein
VEAEGPPEEPEENDDAAAAVAGSVGAEADETAGDVVDGRAEISFDVVRPGGTGAFTSVVDETVEALSVGAEA